MPTLAPAIDDKKSVVLDVSNLVASYGEVKVLHGISFTVRKGEVVTLLGANGAGKSSIMRCITGTLGDRKGEIRFMGERIDRLAAEVIVRLGIALVPEGRRIFPDLTVRENLEMGAYTRGGANLEEDFARVFRLFPVLETRQKQMGGSLSGGEQQMLAIGRALMLRPKLLLLDEPSMGLAPQIVEQIFDLISQLNEDGITILLVEQNANMALSVTHRSYVLETGRIVLEGTAAEMTANKMVKEAYLGG